LILLYQEFDTFSVTTQLSWSGVCGDVVFGGGAPKNHIPNTFRLSNYHFLLLAERTNIFGRKRGKIGANWIIAAGVGSDSLKEGI